MKNRFFTIMVIAALAVGCAGATADDKAAKTAQLQEYKTQLSELKKKIEALETELAVTQTTERVKVELQELQPRLFEHFFEVNGTVEAEADVDVSPESSGVIESVLVREGQQVRRGQTLAVLNTEALQRTADELRIQLDLATTNFTRQQKLWDQNIGSEMQYLQAKSNMEAMQKRVESVESQMNLSVIKAPVDGVVDVVYQKKGEIGTPAIPFAKVINIGNIKIYADVAESYLTKIAQGDKVMINFPSLSREIPAEVFRLGNVIDPNNRTFRVRLNLQNPDKMIKPNILAIVKLRDYAAEGAIVIPTILVKQDFKGSYTYVAEEKDGAWVARKVYVTPGVNDNNLTEITEGLAAGMRIVSEGYAQVVDGTQLEL